MDSIYCIVLFIIAAFLFNSTPSLFITVILKYKKYSISFLLTAIICIPIMLVEYNARSNIKKQDTKFEMPSDEKEDELKYYHPSIC